MPKLNSKSNPVVFNDVLKQTCQAYCDSSEKTQKKSGRFEKRNLNFRASDSVSIDEAIKILSVALDCPSTECSYNNFKASLLRHLPSDSQITLAREGSVCIYVKTKENIEDLQTVLDADELHSQNGEYRIWWD